MRILLAASVVALASCYGPEGASGPQGPSGSGGIRWVDATGATIPGVLVNPFQTERLAVFDGSGNLWGLSRSGDAVAADNVGSTMPFFTTTDCTGPAYYAAANLPYPRVVFDDQFSTAPGFKASPDDGGTDITYDSFDDGVCQTVNGTVTAVDVASLPALTPPTVSAVMPLHPEP